MRIIMAVYTVHEPPPKAYDASNPERFVFVRDGFSLWAFLFGPLWMLRHRMWLALLGYLLLVVGLQIGLSRLGASSTVMSVVALLLALLIGFEAGTLRRFAFARRKWTPVGVIVGDDRETAEQRFFDAWCKRTPRAAPVPPLAAAVRREPDARDIIGLFPEPRGPR
jgi:hypothetical protein